MLLTSYQGPCSPLPSSTVSYLQPQICFRVLIRIADVLGFVMTVTFMFALGNIEEDLADASGQPWVAVILRITGSRAATIVLILIMMFMYFFCAVNQVTCSSRQVFAFARDKGLPYHEFLSRVNRNGVPTNSVYVTLAYTCVLALIIIGSETAFNIILSVSATGLFTSYLVVIGTVLARKLRGEPFPASRFHVPRTIGIVVNIIAICFLSVAFLFLFFPAVPSPNAIDMNWGVLIYGVVTLFSIIYYHWKGKHQYDVSLVQLLRYRDSHTDSISRVPSHTFAMNTITHCSMLDTRRHRHSYSISCTYVRTLYKQSSTATTISHFLNIIEAKAVTKQTVTERLAIHVTKFWTGSPRRGKSPM